MKKVASALVQFCLFLFLDALGGLLLHPFHVQSALSAQGRVFSWDGVILALLGYFLLALIFTLGKRLRTSVPRSTIALVMALLVGYVLKFGFVTHNW